ncbi:MAG: hypothetical protein U1F43_08170 [Myxococcota bacterium]
MRAPSTIRSFAPSSPPFSLAASNSEANSIFFFSTSILSAGCLATSVSSLSMFRL